MRRGESMRDLTTAMMRLSEDIDAQSGSLHQDDDLTVLSMHTGPSTRSADLPEESEIRSARHA